MHIIKDLNSQSGGEGITKKKSMYVKWFLLNYEWIH
jgi:hypothetical protein